MRSGLIVFIVAIVLAADQVSKRLIENLLEPYTAIEMSGIFNIVHIYNRGVSFGLFSMPSSYGPYILSFIGFCIAVLLAFWAFRTDSGMQRIALAVILGGAVSNILDRLDDGAVTDFLDFHIGAYHWPAFNLADVAIVCGAAALLLETLIPAAVSAGQRGKS